MSNSARAFRVVGAAAAVLCIGLLGWWLLAGRGAGVGGDQAAVAPSPAAEAGQQATPSPLPTPMPTATSEPTPTPIPTPLPFTEAMPTGDLEPLLLAPLPACDLVRNDEVVAGTVALECLGDAASVPVVAAANGRVVGVVRSEAVLLPGEVSAPGQWSWAEQAALGPHVVIDHGRFGPTRNTQTVYAGLDSIAHDIRIGTVIGAGDELGTVAGPQAVLRFSIWSDDTRQDGASTLAAAPLADDQRAVAEVLRPLIDSPTDALCPLALAFGQLPGAPRDYRNGTHRGIDFGCGAAERSGHAIADGTVVYVVDDYIDPSVAEREALLQQAGLAGFTPHWTLVMLYGNVVVVDHGDIPGAGRVVTITAHLEEVDPAIEIGSAVVRGQRLGELGNRGTNASAQFIRGAADPSLHLHWELFIDNWYLGQGLDSLTVSEVIATALCGAAQTPGCPA